jgi:type I restriction enzyme S subunit
MNLVGPPLGKVAVVTDQYPAWNVNQALAIFRPISFFDSRYLCYVIGCPSTLREVLEDTRGTAGQDNLSLMQARSLRIPLVTLAYQRRLVQEVEKVSAILDELEAGLRKADTARGSLLCSCINRIFNDSRRSSN